ncbi:MAG: hypothetical protein M3463_04765 [Verrucomicrobiota bacterium]|nr:hypothetical protein [Verrucomicrobiota bacterium]
MLSLAYRPELLLLDEPFGGIDALAKEEFLSGLLEMTQQNEWTILFATNEIGEVERLADQVAILERGRLKLFEPLDELQQRFRRVEVFQALPAGFPREDAIALESADEAFSFVHPGFTSQVESQLVEQFGAPKVRARTMSLKEIFVTLAKSYQLQGSP